jgi:hypothetical protein
MSDIDKQEQNIHTERKSDRSDWQSRQLRDRSLNDVAAKDQEN